MKLSRTIKIVFIGISALLVLIPVLNTNIKINQKSEFDNRALVEFPTKIDSSFPASIDQYVSDRIGFREEMITAYQLFCDRMFNKLVHPSYMYGKNGHICVKNWDLQTYQHLDVNMEFVSAFVAYLERMSAYCKNNNTEFLFFLTPNKETVYPEVYSDGYNIKNQPNRSDRIIEKLKDTDVNYIDPRIYMKEKKKEETLYNKKYDVGHWNDLGAYYGHSLIIERLSEKYPQMGTLNREEFEEESAVMNYLSASKFPVFEEVPILKLRENPMKEKPEFFEQLTVAAPDMYRIYLINEKDSNKPKILILGDSYFENSAKFYVNHCSELLLLHSYNVANFEYYIQEFHPDIVIFEVVERVLEVPGFIDLEGVKKIFE